MPHTEVNGFLLPKFMHLSAIGSRSAVDIIPYRPYIFEKRAAVCESTIELRSRIILRYLLRRHTIRRLPFFDPEMGILII